LTADGSRIFVNVPDSRHIAVIDRASNKQIASWSAGSLRANYPLAIDEAHQRLLAGFRSPASLGVFDLQSGVLIAVDPICADADDVFIRLVTLGVFWPVAPPTVAVAALETVLLVTAEIIYFNAN